MNDVCRVCLDNGEDKTIFFVDIERISGENIDFITIIQIHGGVEVAKDDGLPQKICSNCIPKFTAAHSLWILCQESDRKLRESYKNNENFQQKDFCEAKDPLSQPQDSNQSTNRNPAIMKTEIFISEDNIDDNKEPNSFLDDNSCNSTSSEFDEERDPSWNQPRSRKTRSRKTSDFTEKCELCESTFKKTEQLVKHLHSHKQDSANEVYSILKALRKQRLPEATKNEKITEQKSEEHLEENPDENLEEYAEENSQQTLEESTENLIKKIDKMIQEELDADGPGKSFTCAICFQSFVWKRSLIRHHERIHKTLPLPEEEEKEYKCRICEKIFPKEWKLERHKKTHEPPSETGDTRFKRFLCHICSKGFRHKTGLTFHMRSHTGDKPYICRFCGKGFASSSNCTNHERIHTGVKPYVCHFCSVAFAKSCTLKAHITTHTGEANYHCKTCGKSFRRLKYLKEHKYTHTGEKPYACKLCGAAYSHSGSLFAHEKKCKALWGVDTTSKRKTVERISVAATDQ